MIWAPHVTVAAVIYHQQRYLLVEEQDQGQHVLNQPAGHLEDGEGIIDAVIRETLEETGGHFQPEHFVGIYRWCHRESQQTFLRFCVAGSLSDPDAPLTPQDPDILRCVWKTYKEIKTEQQPLRSPLVLRCIDDFQAGHRYDLDLYQDVV